MLMADESLRALDTLKGNAFFDQKSKLAYYLGAILPDAFFYDLPRFTLPFVGRFLHRYQGEAGFRLCKQLLKDNGTRLSTDLQAFVLGLTTHFLVDGFWHPYINQYSRLNARFGQTIKLSERSYHYWLESRLEEFWLPILGPEDEYNRILHSFQKDQERYGRYIRYYREFLTEAGCFKVPKEARIRRCLFWQTSMLRVVGYSRDARQRSRVFMSRIGRPLADPPHSSRSFLEACRTLEDHGVQNLCDGPLMVQSIQSLAIRLKELLTEESRDDLPLACNNSL